MKIMIFQSLPIQEQTFFDIPLYIYASIILPFLIFFLGQWILHKRDISKENKRLRVLEKYVYFNFDMLLDDLEVDVNNTEKLLSLLKEDKQQNYTAKSTLDIHCENILNLNRTDLYNIFINGKKGDYEEKIQLFDQLLKNAYNIDSNHKEYPNYFKDFIGFMQKYQENYSKSIDILRVSFENYIVQNELKNIKKSQDNFIADYDELLYYWTKVETGETNLGLNKFDMFYVEKNILPQFIEFINNYKTDIRSRKLSDAIIGAAAAIKSFRNLKKLYLDLFQTILNNYKKSKDDIRTTLNKFNQMKEKVIKA